MLSRAKRVNTRLFKEVLNNGHTYHFKFFSARVLKLSTQEKSRFAFVAPKKSFKKAVQRILLRRRGYNIINNEYENIGPPVVALFFLKKGAEELNFNELKQEIILALGKIKILKKDL